MRTMIFIDFRGPQSIKDTTEVVPYHKTLRH